MTKCNKGSCLNVAVIRRSETEQGKSPRKRKEERENWENMTRRNKSNEKEKCIFSSSYKNESETAL